MSTTLRLVRAASTAWGLAGLLAMAGLTIVGVRCFRSAVEVPGRTGVNSLIWPLAPTCLALAVAVISSAGHRVPERLATRSGWSLRLRFIGLLAFIVATISLTAAPAEQAIVARNTAGLLGVALLSEAVLPVEAAWVPVALLATLTWFFGPVGGGRPSSAWAVLLHPSDDGLAQAAALVTGALGVALYLMLDRRLGA